LTPIALADLNRRLGKLWASDMNPAESAIESSGEGTAEQAG